MTKTTAIAMAADYSKLQQLVETGEFTAEDVADTLEGLEGELGDKLDAIMVHVRNIEGQAETLSKESKRLAERKNQFDNQIKNLKQYALTCLLTSGKDSLKTLRNTFTARKGTVSVVIDDESLLPDELIDVQTITAPDKKAIKERIDKGETIDGAHLETGARTLQVR
ncbi:siphovirus Gp157 family protein [Providencia rettgeri]|uniref:Siphovirus Gp157 family protein n=1 Tax=Providencia rettgeri TaxID=587 RepID=A0AAP2NTY0_PRORE|nr:MULTISPECIES: siphovirus Gp157 family protein [Providencia]MBX6951521.1 siphovirus Gp157 family protein [Providencia rettgeri]MBX6954527.1 siphovirus Gp157 family protein [Providencia rettgeri]MBX6959973.1 siphovirus Gp157 family protein [Providencia rettgeri]MBX6972313.1 siphovirus Gp157 family protein [Providencia rettgeri]MBX6978678.1 siphovirus Gp157 family protein [Providencia rettgeri]